MLSYSRWLLGRLSKNYHKKVLQSSINSYCRLYIRPAMETKVLIDNFNINYLKTGYGNHTVLCLPGSLGTIWTDFAAQITGFDQSKFSLIIWEPPGYGKSRPPERDFSSGYLERDAEVACKLLKELNVKNCSLLGWSDGGITAIFIASKYPYLVRKIVIWGSNAYLTDEDIELYEKVRDVSNWSPTMKSTMSNIYGEKNLQNMMNAWVDSTVKMRQVNDGDICRDSLPKITASTVIMHGCKDPLVPQFHAKFLREHIKNAKLHLIQDGKHNIHIKFAEMFNTIVQTFLNEKEK